MKTHITFLTFLFIICSLILLPGNYAEDSWLIEMGAPLYKEIEELSINNAVLPKSEDTPVSAGTMEGM